MPHATRHMGLAFLARLSMVLYSMPKVSYNLAKADCFSFFFFLFSFFLNKDALPYFYSFHKNNIQPISAAKMEVLLIRV